MIDLSKTVADSVNTTDSFTKTMVQLELQPAISKMVRAEAKSAILQADLVSDQLDKFREDRKREAEQEAKQQALTDLQNADKAHGIIKAAIDNLDASQRDAYVKRSQAALANAIDSYLAQFEKKA